MMMTEERHTKKAIAFKVTLTDKENTTEPQIKKKLESY
jgi:hypothetical protein